MPTVHGEDVTVTVAKIAERMVLKGTPDFGAVEAFDLRRLVAHARRLREILKARGIPFETD